jgi:hypothetical protein
MATLGWARCTDRIADVLRRGAWYPIVEEAKNGEVVLEVREKRVRVSRDDLHLRTIQPDRWSIVERTGVLRPTLGGQGTGMVTTYAVCPFCCERQDYTGHPKHLTCDKCGKSAEVDWSETC